MVTEQSFEQEVQIEVAGEIRRNWGWLLFGGIALMELGLVGLYKAGAMTIVSVL